MLENQRPLMQLMADGIIPLNQADFLVTIGISASEFDALLQHIKVELPCLIPAGYRHGF
ncbi:MAG: hypothetical protein PUP91_17070 [Rhizonema sp. PD37]|nr:hypothetical protein [Rhizonema sp. PD37]